MPFDIRHTGMNARIVAVGGYKNLYEKCRNRITISESSIAPAHVDQELPGTGRCHISYIYASLWYQYPSIGTLYWLKNTCGNFKGSLAMVHHCVVMPSKSRCSIQFLTDSSRGFCHQPIVYTRLPPTIEIVV